ncbi:hypothetical protein [Leucobacter sp. GX24907]
MAFDLTRYIAQVKARYIDVDGVFGAQCWDQWSHYAQALGVPAWPTYTNAGGTSPHGGWACNVYHNARSSGLTEWFEILPATATPRAGDVAFWELGSVWFPLSHVATVLSVPRAGMLRCLTQNPGAVQISDFVTRGVIGYLRPKAGIRFGGTVSRTTKKSVSKRGVRTMIMIYTDAYVKDARRPGRRWAIFGPGLFKEIYDQKEANDIKGQLGGGPSVKVDGPTYRDYRAAAQAGMR